MVAQERLPEPRFTMERLLPKGNSLSDLPAFLGPNGKTLKFSSILLFIVFHTISEKRLFLKISCEIITEIRI